MLNKNSSLHVLWLLLLADVTIAYDGCKITVTNYGNFPVTTPVFACSFNGSCPIYYKYNTLVTGPMTCDAGYGHQIAPWLFMVQCNLNIKNTADCLLADVLHYQPPCFPTDHAWSYQPIIGSIPVNAPLLSLCPRPEPASPDTALPTVTASPFLPRVTNVVAALGPSSSTSPTCVNPVSITWKETPVHQELRDQNQVLKYNLLRRGFPPPNTAEFTDPGLSCIQGDCTATDLNLPSTGSYQYFIQTQVDLIDLDGVTHTALSNYSQGSGFVSCPPLPPPPPVVIQPMPPVPQSPPVVIPTMPPVTPSPQNFCNQRVQASTCNCDQNCSERPGGTGARCYWQSSGIFGTTGEGRCHTMARGCGCAPSD